MIHRRGHQKVAFILDFLSLSALQISKFENVIQRLKKLMSGPYPSDRMANVNCWKIAWGPKGGKKRAFSHNP